MALALGGCGLWSSTCLATAMGSSVMSLGCALSASTLSDRGGAGAGVMSSAEARLSVSVVDAGEESPLAVVAASAVAGAAWLFPLPSITVSE